MVEATAESIAVPATTKDVLSEALKQGAQRMLAQVIEAEVAE